MKKNLFILLMTLWQTTIYAQTEKLIHGSVLNDNFPVQGIKVINLVTDKSTVTNNNGAFVLMVKPDDLLVFYGLEYNYKRKSITAKDIYDDNLTIIIDKKPLELKEVVVEKNNLDAVKLGILQTPAKEYTPAERKIREATTGLINPIVNLLTGRTKNLKKLLTIEQQEQLLEKVENLYDDDFYLNKLKIPKDYIKAFQYYIIYDAKFAAAVKAKNRTLTTFRIVDLAQEFNQLLLDKK